MKIFFYFGFFVCVSCTVSHRESSPYLVYPHSPHVEVQKETKREGRSIFLDAGHGGSNLGTVSASGMLQEKALNLEIAGRIERMLKSMNMKVFMSRRTDVFIPLQERVKMANESKADIFVSIHFNHAKNTKVQGAEVFYYHDKKQAMRTRSSGYLASCILKHLVRDLPTPSRGIKHGDLCVIRETTIPSVLVEAVFISNPHDANLLGKGVYKHKISRAIVRGIQEYFANEDHPRRESNARPVA